jgi:hypothetical protein
LAALTRQIPLRASSVKHFILDDAHAVLAPDPNAFGIETNAEKVQWLLRLMPEQTQLIVLAREHTPQVAATVSMFLRNPVEVPPAKSQQSTDEETAPKLLRLLSFSRASHWQGVEVSPAAADDVTTLE